MYRRLFLLLLLLLLGGVEHGLDVGQRATLLLVVLHLHI